MSATMYHSTHPQADAQGRSPDAPNWSGDLRGLEMADLLGRRSSLLQAIGRLFIEATAGSPTFVQHDPNRFEMQEAHRLAGLVADCLNEMERRP